MGGNTSHLSAPPAYFPYFSITFRATDKLKIIDADRDTLALIQQVVADNWCVQSQRNDHGAFEIKLHGQPFYKSSSRGEALASKRLCCELLRSLQMAGWMLVVSSDLSRMTDLTTWFFQRNAAVMARQLPAEGGIMCLSLSSSDKLQLINAPAFLHRELLHTVGGLHQSHEQCGKDFEVKLCGRPWSSADFDDGVNARHLLLDIIRRFDTHKYRFHGTANLKGTADCLFFEHDPNYVPGETRYCMLSLNCNDRIRLLDCPANVVDTVGYCIREYWPRGLQNKRNYSSCVEYKLNGYPWESNGDDAVYSRFLITLVLQELVAQGWAVMSALDVTRRVNDKAVFVLRSCTPASIPHLCISPAASDKIRLINGSKAVENVIAEVIYNNWPYGIQREGRRAGASEWKLHGNPWTSGGGLGGNDYAMARHLMTRLMNEMARIGWSVVCSADVSSKYISQENGPSYPDDVHTWFLAQTGHVAPSLPMPVAPSSSTMSSSTSSQASLPPSYSEAMKFS